MSDMAHLKQSSIPYKQLQQENKALGNIICALQSKNKKLQLNIQQISAQQTTTNSENEALRNITAELQHNLHSLRNTNKNTDTDINKNKSDSIAMHKELLKYNQECVIQLQDMMNEQQSLQQKLSCFENENIRLRQELIEIKITNSSSFITAEKHLENNENENENVSFQDIIEKVRRIEEENKCQSGLKQQVFLLNDENKKMRQLLIEKQNENQALLDKHNQTLKHYEILCQSYLNEKH